MIVVDDYGHHPTEIRATLETLRNSGPRRRTVVLFQPHRYTRTQDLWDEFCRAFHQADVLLLLRHLPRGRGADRGRDRGGPGPRASASGGTGRWPTPGT